MLSDAQWSLIEEMLPRPTGRKGRPFSDASLMVEGIVYRYRCGICRTCWGRGRLCGPGITAWPREGTWDKVLAALTAAADEAGLVDWSLSVDSTIVRADQHATNTKRLTGGWIELHESGRRAA